MNQPSANDLYYEAQRLIKSGQPVFPCRSTGTKAKAPLTRNGLKDATLDKTVVKAWLRQHGTAALAIPTGLVWDVLDIDVKDTADGRVYLPYLRELGLLNGCKKVIQTPSGGWHLYFNSTHGLTNKARGATLGMDVRGLGGYVLVPPSFIAPEDSQAGLYESVGDTIGSSDDPLMWDLIRSAIKPVNTATNKDIDLLPSDRSSSIAALREWVSLRESGERNNGLHWAVCRCIDNGIDPHELVEPALLTGLEEEEILKTIDSALKRAGVIAEELNSEAEAMFADDFDEVA